MKRIVCVALAVSVCLGGIGVANASPAFFRRLIAEVATAIIVDLVKEPAETAIRQLSEAPVSDPSSTMSDRVSGVLIALNDESRPIAERVSRFYASRVHFFGHGVWTREAIQEEGERYRARFRSVSFAVEHINKIETVDVKGRNYVAVNYSARYRHVKHDGTLVSGVSHVAVLLGDFEGPTPRIYAIREWKIERD